MNKNTKKELQEIIDKLGAIGEQLDKISENEQEKFDNLNEGMQAMEKFKKLEENADNLSEASSLLEDVVEYIEGCLDE